MPRKDFNSELMDAFINSESEQERFNGSFSTTARGTFGTEIYSDSSLLSNKSALPVNGPAYGLQIGGRDPSTNGTEAHSTKEMPLQCVPLEEEIGCVTCISEYPRTAKGVGSTRSSLSSSDNELDHEGVRRRSLMNRLTRKPIISRFTSYPFDVSRRNTSEGKFKLRKSNSVGHFGSHHKPLRRSSLHELCAQSTLLAISQV